MFCSILVLVKETYLDQTIIIIGAGAAGLMAGRELSAKGYKIIILEAANHSGGRVSTLTNNFFTHPVEAGAEFVHGKLALTFQILREADIPYLKTGGKMVSFTNGEWQREDLWTKGWQEMTNRLQDLVDDMTIAEFLKTYFAGPAFADLRQTVQSFSEGYDGADITKASTFALREELTQPGNGTYRIQGGYQQLIQYLEGICKSQNCTIVNRCVVKKISWEKEKVKAISDDGMTFTGNKVIITVPLGVLLASPEDIASIIFQPSIEKYLQAASRIGYGSVIKILLQFKNPFWQKRGKNIGFLFTGEIIPTWWTQAPDNYPLLTGWVCGPKASALMGQSDADILKIALDSLAAVFGLDFARLQEILTAWHVASWYKNPFARGGYSYCTLETVKAREILNTAIEKTLFFAGEAYYERGSSGTVEAALASGQSTAQKIIS
jgi:monoamine oxidase